MQPLALWHVSPSESRLAPASSPHEPGRVRVKGLYSLVSTGTERLVATGQVPPELHAAMRVPFMQGSFSFPLTYGYSWVGRVQQAGHPLQGRLVQLMHPHQDLIAVPERALRLVPPEVPPLRATLAANVETALNAIWDARVWPGARVLVVGHGLLGGLLTHLLCRIPAVAVHVLEPDAARARKAKHSTAQVAAELPEAWRHRMDLAFHTSATQTGLQWALDSLADEGCLIELSWYGNRAVSVHLGGRFHPGRHHIRSSQVGRLPAFLPPAWNAQRRMEVVWQLLRLPGWDPLLPQTVPFAQAPRLFERLRQGRLSGWAWAFAYE